MTHVEGQRHITRRPAGEPGLEACLGNGGERALGCTVAASNAGEQAGPNREDLARGARQVGSGFVLEALGSPSVILGSLEHPNQVTFL